MKELERGMDIAELDGSDREPLIRLKLTFSESLTKKDVEKCKEIFERAVSEIKGIIDKDHPCNINRN